MTELVNTPPAALELLRGLIDYAGFFPPAGLPVTQAWLNYGHYQRSPWSPMLGRLVLPAGKLTELAEEVIAPAANAAASVAADPSPTKAVAISAVLPGPQADPANFAVAVSAMLAFNDRFPTGAMVDTIECRVDSVEEFESARRTLDAGPWACFWELPPTAILPDLLAAVRLANQSESTARHFAKIRTGGLVPEAIPALEPVANFLVECARHDVGFKATAGLHHPIRSTHPLTYQPAAPSGLMHGFINLFVAAIAARHGWQDPDRLLPILSTQQAADFSLNDDAIVWRDQTWSIDQVLATRVDFARSFGSCSFTEPVTDLQALGWLPPHSESCLA